MENGLMALGAALAVALSTIFPALAQSNVAGKAMDAIARQPEVAGEVRTSLVISLAFMEALTIYGLLIALMLLGKF